MRTIDPKGHRFGWHYPRAGAFLGACTALLAACTVDTGTDTELGASQQAICKTYPDCGPDPDDDSTPPPPPPPAVSKPDVALQFSPCLPDAQVSQLSDAVRGALPTAADIRALCASGSERIGVWFKLPVGTDDAGARARGLTGLGLLRGSETFSGYINSRFINSNVYATWNAAPKVLNGDGTPNPGGPVHLSSLQVNYIAPNQIASVIRGYDERPWPDVDFTLTTTDTLGTANGRIQCQSASSVDVDTSWLNYLTGILGFVFPPLGLYLVIEDAFPSASDASNTTAASVGCPAVRFFPSEIVVPLGLKVVVSYGRTAVDTSGIVVGGTYQLALRTPSASILGSRSLTAEPGDSVSYGAYAARATDMRAPLSYSWTSSGIVATPSGSGTGITFSLAGHNALGNVKSDTVHLRVVDADGLSAESTASVRTTIRNLITPVCRVKPYLPQCQDL